MIHFKPVQAEDKDVIMKYLKYVDTRSCDFAFATIYLWRDYYRMEYAVCDDVLLLHSWMDDCETFSFSSGMKDVTRALSSLIEYCSEMEIPLVFNSITKKEEKWLNNRFPGQFTMEYNRDFADYIYETEALIALRGKKYHGKKNHINKFMKTYDWSYERVTDDNLSECLALLKDWESEKSDVDDYYELAAEVEATSTALIERDFLGLKAGLIRADGRVVAFALGEEICDDTFCVHVEKAYSNVAGAYAIINQQFLIHEAADYRYVNREDDVGDPGLRKAKLSYHPAILLEKGVARYNG